MILTISRRLLSWLDMDADEFLVELAIHSFKEEKLSMGQACRLARKGRVEFHRILGRREIPIHYDVEDFEADIKTMGGTRPPMTVVSDSSAPVCLAAIGRLSILQELYGRVIIPTAVYEEIASVGVGQPGATEAEGTDGLEVRKASCFAYAYVLREQFDAGEAEAIAIARELKADLLIMDEPRARRVASRYAIKQIGLPGVLAEAKQRGVMPTVRPVLDKLVDELDLRISRELRDRLLQRVGEEE